jgi:hypothetical protein
MTVNFPRRDKPAAKVGPRLEISPLELKEYLAADHGLSKLLLAAESWEPFAWKGNDLSAPVRALYAAEAAGLLSRRGDRAIDVPIADIAVTINNYLLSLGRSPVTENSVLNNLRTVSQYIAAAVGAAIIPDRKTMTVRFIDQYETAENIEKYFDQLKTKLTKLGAQLKHAEACGYEVSHILEASAATTGVRVLEAAA